MSTQKTLNFTVDSALLLELGERLVGKPYIALAELVKNSYDADSRDVVINFNPQQNFIEINDTGHGMTEEEFEFFWMRVGSTHKVGNLSRNFKRRMTGSKGVGRLAVQYLAEEFEMTTVSEKDTTKKLKAVINWREILVKKNLTDVAVIYEILENKNGFSVGTSIKLSHLKHIWTVKQVRGLAQEIWWLRPPFRTKLYSGTVQGEIFEINFISQEREFVEVFNWQIKAIMNIWHARIVGENQNGNVTISVEYTDEDPIVLKYVIDNCEIQYADWELRVYYLANRQPYNISVKDARKYLKDFGGVYVYDSGFQLPFYGNVTNDWLKIQYDFSQRLTASELLPKGMREKGGLQFLPTLSRLLGIVNISTVNEDNLDILITRDRLNEDKTAFTQLVNMVRTGLDLYSLEERKRRIKDNLSKMTIEKPKPSRMLEVLDLYRESIEEDKFDEIKKSVENVIDEFETESEIIANQVSIIGPLATAGISTLAIEHETKWQTKTLDSIIKQIDDITYSEDRNALRNKIGALKKDLIDWSLRVKQQSSLFDYFKDADNLTHKARYSIRLIIEDVITHVSIFARDVKFDTTQIEYTLFPIASVVEWTSIFQNVFLNAFNAMLDSEKRLISIKTIYEENQRTLLIQDTGVGINLKKSESLFEPFVRGMKTSAERRELEYGGSGLGLTIVRLIARNIGCSVSFVQPDPGFSTAFALKWSEKNG